MSEGAIHHTGKRGGDAILMTDEEAKRTKMCDIFKPVREYSAVDVGEHIHAALHRYEDRYRQEAVRYLEQQHMKDALRYLVEPTMTHGTGVDFRKPVPDPNKRPSRVLLLL